MKQVVLLLATAVPVVLASVVFAATSWRWLRVVAGGVGAFFVAGVAGLFISLGYDRLMYEPEPDPVHFDIAFVWLSAWTTLWLTASGAIAYVVYRR